MRVRGSLHDPGWLAVVLVSLVAVAAIVTLAADRLIFPGEDAVISTGEWPWSASGVAVQPLTPDSAFHDGDVVVAINGRSLADWATDAMRPPWLFAPQPIGSSVSVDVVRDGGPATIKAELAAFPMGRLGGAPLALVVFGATALVLAVVLVGRRPQATALRLLMVGVICDVANIVAWETGLQPTDLVARTPFLYAFAVSPVFAIIFWSSLLHLLSVYPVRSRWLIRRPGSVGLLYAAPIAALVVVGVIAALPGGGTLAWIGRLGTITAGVISALIVSVLAAIVLGYRRTPLPRRRQVRLLAMTLFVAAATDLALVTGPIAVGASPLVSRATVALFALPVVAALALAVVRDHLFQVDLLASSRAGIVGAREEERRRLRRDLHDGLGPTLAALGLKIDVAREHARAGDSEDAIATLDEVRADVRAIVSQIRIMARELRPPALDSLGLVAAVRQQVEALTASTSLAVDVVADVPPALPAGVEVAAYRIIVEAVANVARHAGASRASVRLSVERDALVIEVADDGVGIDEGATGVGTRAIHERAAEVGGEVAIEPGRDGGTIVSAVLPLRTRPGTTPEDRSREGSSARPDRAVPQPAAGGPGE